MAFKATEVFGEGHRYVLKHWRTLAFLAAPAGLVNSVIAMISASVEPPLSLVALPFLLLSLWFSLALVVTILRAFPQGPGRVRFWGLFRLGRGELRLSRGRFWKSVFASLLPAALFGMLSLGVSVVFIGAVFVAALLHLPPATFLAAGLLHGVLSGTLTTASILWYAAIAACLFHRLRDTAPPGVEDVQPVPVPPVPPPSADPQAVAVAGGA